jgi:hypothetical protein
MVKRICVLCFSLFISVAIGCGGSSSKDKSGGDGGNGSSDVTPQKVGLKNPKALFLSSTGSSNSVLIVSEKIGVNNDTASSTSGSSLYQVLQDGSFEKVPFTKSDGTEVTVRVNNLKYLSDTYIALNIQVTPTDVKESDTSTSSDDYAPRNIIIEKSTGTIYDFKNYVLFSQISGYFSDPLMLDGYLYVLSGKENMPDGTLCKIDMTTKTSTPMNNPAYLSVARFYHVANGDFLVFNNGTTAIQLLLHDGSAPMNINSDQYSQLTEMTSMGGGDWIGLVYGTDGKLYDVDCDYVQDSTGTGSDKFVFKYLSFSSGSTGLTITSSTICEFPVAYTPENTTYTFDSYDGLFDRNRVIVCRGGYLVMTPKTGGGFSFTYGAKDLTSLLTKIIAWNGTKAYYTETVSGVSVLKCWDIASGNDPITVISDQNVNTLWMVGSELYYTVYASATTVQTWKMTASGTKSKVSDSSMNISDIVVFSL